MRKALVSMSLVAALLFAGCKSSETLSDGQTYECIGVQDDPNPRLTYEVSVRNVVLGIVFFETIFAPLIWLLADFRCPTDFKPVPRPTI